MNTMLIYLFFLFLQDYDGFFESKESNTVFSFLGLKPSLASKVSVIWQNLHGILEILRLNFP